MLVFSRTITELEELDDLAKDIFTLAKNYNVWLLEGEMGAGKTTFVKHLAFLWGIQSVSSPSFSLVNSYYSPLIGEVYHFDFYRINSEAEAWDIGTDEYFSSGNYCLVEWSSNIKSLIPEKFAKIEINLCNLNQRTFNLYLYGGQDENRD